MPVILDWKHVAVRLIASVVVGVVIGFNRGEHGRPAGMCTTLLVCLASSLSMIEANLLMNSVGKAHDSFVVLDLMRLPLGILSGMGFIGAGAILRKENLVLGVTTAATLWFTTMMGLCFGGGQIGLGSTALLLGVGTLWGLKEIEKSMRQDLRATLVLVFGRAGPSETEIRQSLADGECTILSWNITYQNHGERCEARVETQRRVPRDQTHPPRFVTTLAAHQGVEQISWKPEGLSADPGPQHTDPRRTPASLLARGDAHPRQLQIHRLRICQTRGLPTEFPFCGDSSARGNIRSPAGGVCATEGNTGTAPRVRGNPPAASDREFRTDFWPLSETGKILWSTSSCLAGVNSAVFTNRGHGFTKNLAG